MLSQRPSQRFGPVRLSNGADIAASPGRTAGKVSREHHVRGSLLRPFGRGSSSWQLPGHFSFGLESLCSAHCPGVFVACPQAADGVACVTLTRRAKRGGEARGRYIAAGVASFVVFMHSVLALGRSRVEDQHEPDERCEREPGEGEIVQEEWNASLSWLVGRLKSIVINKLNDIIMSITVALVGRTARRPREWLTGQTQRNLRHSAARILHTFGRRDVIILFHYCPRGRTATRPVRRKATVGQRGPLCPVDRALAGQFLCNDDSLSWINFPETIRCFPQCRTPFVGVCSSREQSFAGQRALSWQAYVRRTTLSMDGRAQSRPESTTAALPKEGEL